MLLNCFTAPRRKRASGALVVALLAVAFAMSAPVVYAQAGPAGTGSTQDPTTVISLPNPLGKLVGDAFTTGLAENQGAAAVSIIIGRVLQVLLGLLGVAGLVVLVSGGVMLLTAGGSDERVTKGRQIITGAFLGLLVIFAGYFIIEVVLRALKG